jgi:ABC-type uncharacterized transport system substrate-binding protein
MTFALSGRCASVLGALIFGLPMLVWPVSARAHPHVFVDVKSELVFDTKGQFTAVRHQWTFDEMFSSYAVQGLDKDKNGEYSAEELQPLAQINIDSLKEFDNFTFVKVGKDKHSLGQARNYTLSYDKAATKLTLSFELPETQPRVMGKEALSVEVYDPTFYVSFKFVEKDPVKLVGAPNACVFNVIHPATEETASRAVPLSEAFFQSLNASSEFGAKFANRMVVNCP